jgi:dTDP-4-dehydrorhamnose 3,5-epimerase
MRIVKTDFADLFLLEPERAQDERGYFVRTYGEDLFRKHQLETHFVEWGAAYNRRLGTMRGLHYQRAPYAETKIVRCTSGAVHDVVVDIRPESPTYLRSFPTTLSQENGLALYIGKGFAHGYQTLTDWTELSYAMSTGYQAEAATGLRWDDPAIAVAWPMLISLISDRDRNWPLIGNVECGLPQRGEVIRR